MAGSENIVVETALRILRDRCDPALVNEAEKGSFPAALWSTLEESGLTLAWVPEELGGAGAEIADGFGVLRVAGGYAAPVPLAETLMAGFLLARAGITSPAEGPMTIAPVHAVDRLELDAQGRLGGTARDVPFARWTKHIAVSARRGGEEVVALVATADGRVTPGQSLAGEPRDTVAFDAAPVQEAAPGPGFDGLTVLGAAVRSMQMAGALERALNQSLQHAVDRVQFGRPIGNFQAIQHYLAQFAGEAAAAGAAADAAAEAIATGGATLTDEDTLAEVATAKIRVGEAASVGSAFAHQIHGAMGFTYELTLHHVTRRLWSWRDEFGSEAEWSIRLGALAGRLGADQLWPFVTGVRA